MERDPRDRRAEMMSGDSSPPVPPPTDAVLLETGDYVLTETGDHILLE